jgi:hypothetical protein
MPADIEIQQYVKVVELGCPVLRSLSKTNKSSFFTPYLYKLNQVMYFTSDLFKHTAKTGR